LLAGLGDGRSVIRGLSGGEDNLRTVAALGALGVKSRSEDPGMLVVEGAGLDGLSPPQGTLDCGNSGTSMRLLSGVLAGQPLTATLDGDAYLRARPMARVINPLRAMGARVEGAAGRRPGELYPPLEIEGRFPLEGIDHTSPVASAQVKSAILLAGLRARARVRVREPGPSRDHTERMLAGLGVPIVRPAPGEVVLDGRSFSGRLPARDWVVPGDPSSAAFLVVAAVLTPGSEVCIGGVCTNPTRTGFLDALAIMGADITLRKPRDEGGEPVADLVARAGRLRAATLAGELVVRAIDEIPILAVAAAFADGTTVIRDAAELRVKESDRLAQIARELERLGVLVRELPDGLEIDGGAALRGGVICQSGGDHRIAMACAVAGLRAAEPIEIEDTDNVATSFPSFPEALGALGAELDVLAGDP
jgi:3-phosphoshikimate 1-carboxyvinyltransferase